MAIKIGDWFVPRAPRSGETWIVLAQDPTKATQPQVLKEIDVNQKKPTLKYVGPSSYSKDIAAFEIYVSNKLDREGWICFMKQDVPSRLMPSKAGKGKADFEGCDDDFIIRSGKRFSVDILKAAALMGRRHEIVGFAAKGLDFVIQSVDKEKGTLVFSLHCTAGADKYFEWETAILEFKKIVKQGGI